MGSNAYVPGEFREAVDLIESHQASLSGFISHRFPISKFNEALIAARQKQSFTMKIVLEIGGVHYD
jgi:threonine dehydrogenase-like Zn-dependent dehydrogenase